MVNMIVNLIIILLVVGFLYYVWSLLRPVIAAYVAGPFMTLVDILVIVLVGAIVLFYAIIPFLHALGGASGTLFR